ncbi:MAG TPA: Hpt domain-containing protein [Sulfurovum sp.]|nr:Hpt domain-containing protein [Sulfurovum sp.]
MLALTILSIFILIIVLIIFLEYRNEKKYQAKRRSESKQKTKPRKKLKVRKVSPKPEVKPEPTPKPEPVVEPEPVPEPEVVIAPEPEPVPEPEPIPEPEVVEETKVLPEVKYPKFSHARLVEMGLSDEEAVEFVQELIPQIELQIPLIEEVMNIPDFHQMERLTHSIKGSATNIGTGGVSDLLVECNTYLKSGTDIDIAKVYFEALKHYTKELREQYA